MTRSLRRAWVPCLLWIGLCVGCSMPAEQRDRPLVVVSVPPQRFVVERLAGDLVEVRVLIPPGASPTLHEPTLSELRSLSEASLYVKVGHPAFPFERAWLDRLLADHPELRVVDAHAAAASDGSRDGDPHLWVAPRHVARMSAQIATALIELLPEAGDQIAANERAFAAEIDQLDARIRVLLAERRGDRFLVLHPAWGYFAREYGLEQAAVEHDHKHPDAREIANLIERAKRDGTRVVFVQPGLDPTAAELIATEIDGRVEVIDPLAYDWPSNLLRTAQLVANAATP